MNQQMIEQVLAELEQPMLETLKTLVRIPSVKAEPQPGAPFGKPAREALDKALEICAGLGFECANIDGYAGHADLGEGSTEDALAVLGHLDVVPVGDGWTNPPFEGVTENGRMYGRGTNDDKGPALAALFAMRAVRDAGIPLKKSIRLILGCDEESDWKDMEYYGAHEKIPDTGFSPDAMFPMINTEKGMLVLELRTKASASGLKVL